MPFICVTELNIYIYKYIYNRSPLNLVEVLCFEEFKDEQILFNIYVLIKNVGYIQINFHRNLLLTVNIAVRKLSTGYSR